MLAHTSSLQDSTPQIELAIEHAADALRTEIDAGLPDFASWTVFGSLVYMSEQRAADYESLNSLRTHPIDLTDGSFTMVSYRDGREGMDELTEVITRSRQEWYKKANLLQPSAKAADEIRGPQVEFYAVIETRSNTEEGNEAEEVPIASFRKVHGSKPGAIHEMPSHQKFVTEDALSDEGRALIEERVKGREVVEIAALWKEKGYAPDGQMAMYRQAIHDSIARNEVWFMGVVDKVHGDLTTMFGPRVIRDVGERIEVKGEDAVEGTYITPALVDPSTFFDDMLDGVDDDKAAGRNFESRQKRWVISYFLEGLDMSLLSEETIARLDDRQPMGVEGKAAA